MNSANSVSTRLHSLVGAETTTERIAQDLLIRQQGSVAYLHMPPKANSTLSISNQTAPITASEPSHQLAANAVLRLKPIQPGWSFEPLQEWEGFVTNISAGGFSARLVDKTRKQVIEDEEADFHIEDISDSDLPFLKPGAIFRWVLGYERSPAGTKRKASALVFRRLPAWSKKEIETSFQRAEEFMSAITWK